MITQNMKKIITTLLMLLCILPILPAIAAPKTKTSFTSSVTLIAGNPSIGTQVIDGDMLYVTQAVSIGTLEGDITGSLWTKLSGFGNLATMDGSFQGKFRIDTIEEVTFEGTVVGIVTGNLVSGSFVGFSNGTHDRQKIKGSFSGNVEYGSLAVNLVMNGLVTSKD